MHHETTVLLIEVGALLLFLGLLGRLGRRIGLSPIPLYLLAGLAFGHGGLLPLNASEEFFAVGAEIGVILLLVMLGLEYTAGELVGNLRSAAPAGLVDAALNALPGAAFALLLGWGWVAAVVLGRHHLGLLVRGDRQGARRPRPARQPGDPGDPLGPGHRGPGDGALPAAGHRAAGRHRPARRRRSRWRRGAARWCWCWSSPSGTAMPISAMLSVEGPGGAAARRARPDPAGRRASRRSSRSRRRSARSWSASRCPGRWRTTPPSCCPRCGTCSRRSSSSSSGWPPTRRHPAGAAAGARPGRGHHGDEDAHRLLAATPGRHRRARPAGGPAWRLMPRGEFSIVIAGLAVAAGTSSLDWPRSPRRTC